MPPVLEKYRYATIKDTIDEPLTIVFRGKDRVWLMGMESLIGKKAVLVTDTFGNAIEHDGSCIISVANTDCNFMTMTDTELFWERVNGPFEKDE